MVVTGLGMLTALGSNVKETWAGLLSGSCGLEADSCGGLEVAAGRVKNFSVTRGSRVLALALAASREALGSAALMEKCLPCACIAGVGKPELGEGNQGLRLEVLSAGYLQASLAAALSQELRLMGPTLAVSAACATGAVAVGLGFEWIREGRCSRVLIACAESPLHPLYVAGFRQMGVLAPLNGSAKGAVKPFDRRRAGFGLGEGAAAVLLEEEGLALRRGATPLAEMEGFSQMNAGGHSICFDHEGICVADALSQTMRRTGRRPADIDYLNCHGTATLLNDAMETRAVKRAFGKSSGELSLSSTKASTGHLLSATGAVEAAFAVLASRNDQIPPTLNLEESDPDCDLDFTPLVGRSRRVRRSMSLSFGFGGAIGALLFSKS